MGRVCLWWLILCRCVSARESRRSSFSNAGGVDGDGGGDGERNEKRPILNYKRANWGPLGQLKGLRITKASLGGGKRE
jgi:hypothetical protein